MSDILIEDKEAGGLKVDMRTNLREFTRQLWQEYEKGEKNLARRLAISMLGYMHKDEKGAHTPRTICTIGDIYSFSKEEIRYGFRCYGEKTWMALNDILAEYGMPTIRLPEEYTW